MKLEIKDLTKRQKMANQYLRDQCRSDAVRPAVEVKLVRAYDAGLKAACIYALSEFERNPGSLKEALEDLLK